MAPEDESVGLASSTEAHSLQLCIPQLTSSRRYRSRRTIRDRQQARHKTLAVAYIPLITFPRAVFLKNFRCVITASVRGLFLMVISTILRVERGREGENYDQG